MFGHPVPQEILDARGKPRSYYGARAIFDPTAKNPIDIPFDRQECEPECSKSPLLYQWFYSEGLAWLREESKKLTTDSEEVLRHDKGKLFGLVASPKRSYGYLYIGAWRYDTDTLKYELDAPPEGAKWSGDKPIPAIGTMVAITMNKLGSGTVLDYFVEGGYLGVRVHLERQPEWHKKQNPNRTWAMVFGKEITY